VPLEVLDWQLFGNALGCQSLLYAAVLDVNKISNYQRLAEHLLPLFCALRLIGFMPGI
jgi:hypothetical protein